MGRVRAAAPADSAAPFKRPQIAGDDFEIDLAVGDPDDADLRIVEIMRRPEHPFRLFDLPHRIPVSRAKQQKIFDHVLARRPVEMVRRPEQLAILLRHLRIENVAELVGHLADRGAAPLDLTRRREEMVVRPGRRRNERIS